MAGLYLPHTLDIFLPNEGGLALARAYLRGYFEVLEPKERSAQRAISELPIATLWLGAEARPFLAKGMQVFWRDWGSWWTMQGEPYSYDATQENNLIVPLVANMPDGLFMGSLPRVPLVIPLGNTQPISSVKVEVATEPGFATPVLTAWTASSTTGWLYAQGEKWFSLPGGLPAIANLKVGYVPSVALPQGDLYVRWTSYIGAAPEAPLIQAIG